MRKKFASFNDLIFTDGEYPTSFKFNQMKNLMEHVRTSNGPYNIVLKSQLTATSFSVELIEDPTTIGGLASLGLGTYKTRFSFRVMYETREDETSTYAAWETYFTDLGSGKLTATLTSGDNIYSNEVDVSDINSNALYCMRSSGYYSS